MDFKHFTATAKETLQRWFRHRNLIVISDRTVVHYNFSPGSQKTLFAALLLMVCFVSYALGSFMAGRSILTAKDETLHATLMENRKLVQEFSMLKRDLLQIRVDEDKLSDYGKFLLKQYTENPPIDDGELSESGIYVTGDGAMARITYLEDRMNEIQLNNARVMQEIHQATDGKIHEFENIFDAAGLDDKEVKKAVASHEKKSNKRASEPPADDGDDDAGVGGPFMPADPIRFDLDSSLILNDVHRMMRMNNLIEALPLGDPIRHAQVKSGFGRRDDPFTHRSAIHTGMDIAGPANSPIYSTGNGRVKFAGRMPGYGNAIDIDHGHGFVTRYGHLSQILVKSGESIEKGEKIGVQGSTGRSTGPHLHYEVRKYGKPVNPWTYIEAGRKLDASSKVASR